MGRIVAFVCACAAADLASLFGAFGMEIAMRALSTGPASSHIPLPVPFAGGFVGAFVIVAAALLLLRPQTISWRSLRSTLLAAAGGGLLGIMGWRLGTLHSLLDSSHQQEPYFVLFAVWQTGVAFVLGLTLRHQQTLVAHPNVIPPKISARQNSKVITACFLCAVFGFLGWQAIELALADRATAVRQQALKKSYAEAPSIENLPSVRTRTADQALVLEDIAGLSVGQPSVQAIRAKPSFGLFPSNPQTIIYSVQYRPKDTPHSWYHPIVTADVTQFPNSEWARYKTKYPSSFNPALDDPKSLLTVTKFGNQVIMDGRTQYPEGTGELDFLWPSEDFVINLRYQTREVNEDFLKRYLDTYPSSLGPEISR